MYFKQYHANGTGKTQRRFEMKIRKAFFPLLAFIILVIFAVVGGCAHYPRTTRLPGGCFMVDDGYRYTILCPQPSNASAVNKGCNCPPQNDTEYPYR